MMTFIRLCCMLLILSSLCVGCGGRVHDIEGTVTLDGKPLDSGYVIFWGKAGKGTEGGARIVDGHYSGQATSGPNRIQVRGFMKLDKPVPDPNLDGAWSDKKQVTFDSLHWDNPNLLVDVNGSKVDIHLTSNEVNQP